MMRILVATDAFPPVCGGSGWSTYELARGLRERGHEVCIVQAHAGPSWERGRSYDGFRVRAIEQPAPAVPFVRNYFKNERLWARADQALRAIAADAQADILHAQHVLTSPAAVAAGAAVGLPVVCTELGTGTTYVNLDGVTGLVTPPRDPAALAAAINALIADPDRRAAMSRAAQDRVAREFNLDVMVDRVLALYGDLIR